MANKTVYPFGIGGSLPSSVGIIDDLITGGADKALSAEMGKVLNGTTVTTEAADFSKGVSLSYIITSTTPYQWTNSGGCLLLPLSGKTKVTCTASGGNCVIAFLKDGTHSHGGTPNFSTTYPYRIQILSGNTEEYDVPSDATLLYIQSKLSGGDNILSRYSITFTIIKSTIARTADIENLQSQINEIKGGNLAGKKISIIGDSISCFGTENQTRTAGYNAPYWIVKSVDVGQTIQSWVTWLDVYTSVDGTTPTGKTIGGVALTAAMIGTKQTFTPVAEDVGKAIGVPRWASSYTTKPWWQVLIDKTGAVLCNNASWSGSRIIPIPEGNARHDAFVLSEAFSEYTLKRVCNRDNEGNTIVPDIIIIYRGTNDFSAEDPEGGVVSDDDESIETPNMLTFNGITDDHNFTQGYIWTILKLRELYPNAYIVLCTLNIFKRVNYSRFPVNNGTYTLPDYNNKIREIADLMGCGLIELDKDGITFENCYPTYISDNATTPTHPNTNGHRVMGEKAISDLRYSLNPTE